MKTEIDEIDLFEKRRKKCVPRKTFSLSSERFKGKNGLTSDGSVNKIIM